MKTNAAFKLSLFLSLFIFSINGSLAQQLVLVNSDNGKEKVIGTNEKITIWIGEEMYSGKYTLVDDSQLIISGKTHQLDEITAIKANSKNARRGGVTLLIIGALPVMCGGIAAIADGGNTLLTPIALGIMTLGAPPIIAGSCVAFIKKKRDLNESWELTIK